MNLLLSRSDAATAFDEQSSSLIKLNNSTVLYLREVNKFLALVCILREDNFSRQGVIDYNFLCFREAIHKVFEVRSTEKNELDGPNYEDDVDDDDDENVNDEEDDIEDEEDDEEVTNRQSSFLEHYGSDGDDDDDNHDTISNNTRGSNSKFMRPSIVINGNSADNGRMSKK